MISLKQEQNFNYINYRTITKVHLFHLCDQDIFNIFYAVCKGRQHDPVITSRDSNKRAESSTSNCPLQVVMIFTPLNTDPFLEQSTMRTQSRFSTLTLLLMKTQPSCYIHVHNTTILSSLSN